MKHLAGACLGLLVAGNSIAVGAIISLFDVAIAPAIAVGVALICAIAVPVFRRIR